MKTLLDVSRFSEKEARKYLENVRWPDGPICPHCESNKIYVFKGKAHRDGLYKCGDCRKQFTVTVNTIMHGSHLTLRQWVLAFHLIASSKKGISALQLQRNLGLGSYKSAWHLAHRIRLAMTQEPLKNFLEGDVEVDETYVGGKGRGKRGRGSEKKTPVLALVERGGNIVSKPIERVDSKTLKKAIRDVVKKTSTIFTDEWRSYWGIGKEFDGGHQVIRHKAKEYVRGRVHTNTAESYFSLLKRGINGIFHHVSKQHLLRYCDEFAFRWNTRKMSDGERVQSIINRIGGKRLSYKPIKGLY